MFQGGGYLSINIYYDRTRFRLKEEDKLKKFIIRVIAEHKRRTGELNFIFTRDRYLIEINREFLNHDYFTDVIAFDYSEESLLNGEVYISIDTVKRNSKKYECDLNTEASRVMLHGVLHLCGLNDIDPEDREVMQKEEEGFMALLKKWLLNGF